MPTSDALLDSYCRAYAKGIVQFLLSGEPQTVFFDHNEHAFGTEASASGMSPTDVNIWIADGWRNLVGPTTVQSDPTSSDFKAGALEHELATRLKTSRDAIAYYKQAVAADSDA